MVAKTSLARTALILALPLVGACAGDLARSRRAPSLVPVSRARARSASAARAAPPTGHRPPAATDAATGAPHTSAAAAGPAAPARSGATGAPATATAPPRVEDDGPWRLGEALGAPEWLDLGLEQRTRYEYLDEDFRIGRDGNRTVVALRTLLRATFHFDPWRVGVELADSRLVGGPDDDLLLNSSIVNTTELLQGYVAWTGEDVLSDDDTLDVQLGRHTMDVGSRRLIARNRFRNTINAFTGVNALWSGDSGEAVRTFFVLPVRRLPRGFDELEDGDFEIDQEEIRTRFFGAHGAFPAGDRLDAEAYAYGLDERDEADVPTRDRKYLTLGGRLRRPPEPGGLDFEWESALQLGESRFSTSDTDTADLEHRAQFHHLSVGYRFDGEMQPRIEGLFDYASGDRDPNDGENNRFDTLYGARRFEYGPTGIFGAFARSNDISPGVRFTLRPSKQLQLMLTHRLHWLASKKDAWVPSGLRDPTGDSGRFVGQLAEIRLRYDVLPRNVRLETGFAYLFAGEFIEEVPTQTGPDDTYYVYFSVTFSI